MVEPLLFFWLNVFYETWLSCRILQLLPWAQSRACPITTGSGAEPTGTDTRAIGFLGNLLLTYFLSNSWKIQMLSWSWLRVVAAHSFWKKLGNKSSIHIHIYGLGILLCHLPLDLRISYIFAVPQ